MAVKKLNAANMRLKVMDDGFPTPVRRLMLVERDGAARSAVMWATDVPAGAVERVVDWFESVGVAVERHAPPGAAGYDVLPVTGSANGEG